MRYHRGLLFWGLALITGGAVALAAQQGYIDRTWLAGAWRLWPLILVAIGLSILLARTPAAIIGTIVAALVAGTIGGSLIVVGGNFTCGGADPTKLTTRHGTLNNDANVELNFSCGTLRVGMADSAGWTVASGQTGGSAAGISADSNLLGVRSPTDGWLDHGRQRWDVTLPRVTKYHMLEIQPNAAETSVELAGGTFAIVSVHPNAGSLFLDLTDATVRELGMSLNAGSASILIGPGRAMAASLSVNAGSIDLCTTGDVALRISSDSNFTFSTNLDDTDLLKSGHTWSTVGYDAASARVSIDLTGNAGSFTLNPEGGCS